MSLCRSWPLPRPAAVLAAALLLTGFAVPSRAQDIDKVRDAVRDKLTTLQKTFASAPADTQAGQILRRTRIDSVEKGAGNSLEFKGVCLYVELNAPAAKAN